MANILEMLSTLGTPGENAANPDLNARLRTLVTQPAAEIPAGLPIVRNQPDPGSTQSILNALRKRVLGEFEDEQARQVADLGRGLLASRSPNFFTALGEGLAAQEAGTASRMDRLRQLAETERQQRALDIEEARRQEELRLREEELRLNAPLRAAQARQAEAMANFYAQGGSRAGRGEVTPQIRLRAEGQALSEARTLFPDPPSTSLTREADAARVQRERQAYIASRVPALLESLGAPGQAPATPVAPAAPAVPTIEVNPVGRPAR